jgi:hypothetical protein
VRHIPVREFLRLLDPGGQFVEVWYLAVRVLVVVDQPATIGALPVTVACACGVEVAYLPGLAMRRIADLHPGKAKTDARDAFVVADAARRRVDVGDDALAELEVLVGYDDDLAQESTRLINHFRGLLTHIHPALERAIGPKLDGKAALAWSSRQGGPGELRKAGRRKLTATAVANAPRADTGLVEAIMVALDEQTVVVPGTAAAETVLPRLADALRDVLHRRAELAAQVEEILDAHPLASVLISMPGIGIRTAARISRRRLVLPHARPPRRVRRHRARHPPLRQLDPRRASGPRR